MSGLRSFDANVDILAELAGLDALRQPEAVLMLPSRRACERFKQLAMRRPGFLPTLMPLGEIDELWLAQQAMAAEQTEALLAIGAVADEASCVLELAEALAHARFVDMPLQPEQRLSMAEAMWEVMQQLAAEGKLISALRRLPQAGLSEHWQHRFAGLAFAADWWQRRCKRTGEISATERRNQQAEWLASYWRERPPQAPVIIAGSTGSLASTATLMEAVKELPSGEVWMQEDDSANWNNPQPMPSHIRRLDARDEQEEAELAALLAREALEDTQASVAIISSSPEHIRMLKAALSARGITADSAVGDAAQALPSIRLFLLMLDAAGSPVSPQPWLALMKMLGMQAHAERLEVKMLRGRGGYQPMPMRIRSYLQQEELTADAIDALDSLLQAMEPLCRLAEGEQAPEAVYAAHIAAWQALCNADAHTEAILQSLEKSFAGRKPIDIGGYSTMVRALLARQKVFERRKGEARVKLYSPIEARLMRADRVILCGLNEGEWPKLAGQHPWLHPALSGALGLAPPEQALKLSAHDFFTLSQAGREVFWLRSQRTGGAEQLPSRWLERFEMTEAQAPYLRWLRVSKQTSSLTTERPSPNPPPEAFPSRITISEMTMLLRDPYAFYAKCVLGLKPLEPLSRPADAALRGQIVHRVMEEWVIALNEGVALSIETYEEVVAKVLAREKEPMVRYQWAPRLHAMGPAIVALEQVRREQANEVIAEQSLATELAGIRIEGRADRVEQTPNGSAIIDYKTGAAPSLRAIEQGLEPQLPLLAMMLDEATYELAYWELTGVHGRAAAKPLKAEAGELIEYYKEGLAKLLAYYKQKDAHYIALPQPAAAPRINDYAHLARQESWSEY